MKLLTQFKSAIHRSQFLNQLTTTGVLGLTGSLLLLIGLSWLCQEVWEKESFQFDTTLLLRLHQLANPGLDRLMLSITRLGDPDVVVGVVSTSFGWLLWKRQRLVAGAFVIACMGTLVLNQGMKLAFARPRPILWPRLIQETSYGFPSGHALGSLVLYGFMAYVLACRYPQQSRSIYSITVGLIASIGLSRLYLGVHYPTDVFAGYAVGFLWLMVCISLLKWTRNKLG